MQWTGHGLIIGVRRHGETSLILEAMVAGRGRCLGLVRGGRSRRLSAALQPGNSVQLTWRARLDEHLGAFTVEPLEVRAARLIENREQLYAAQVLFEHLRLLPERDPHDALLEAAVRILDADMQGLALAEALVRFELLLLDELGFGLDLESCAATGATTGLTHVSPRTGRAVSEAAAQPFLDRLLKLPDFLQSGERPDAVALLEAFALTGHFLYLSVWGPRLIEPPPTRDAFLAHLRNGAEPLASG